MTSIGYLVLGILGGVAILAVLLVLGWLIFILTQTAKQVQQVVKALERAAQVFEKSSDMSAHMVALVGVQRRLISSTEAMTAAVKVFTGLVLKDDSEPPPPQQAAPPPRWPGAPPPPIPQYDRYAEDGEAGVISQDEEDIAELERQAELREQGVETDPLRIQLPTPDQINLSQV
jgi:hypothetical protein